MFAYYIELGLRSLKRNPVLTALMVLGIALGIAASMTSLTLFHMMGSDPIPSKSTKLHYVQLDTWDPNQPFDEEGNAPDQVTYRDAQALMEAGKADRQAAMYKVSYPIQPENPEVKPFLALGRATYSDFFPMFEPPFRYGGAWDHGQDSQHGRVVVLSKATNEKLFGGAQPAVAVAPPPGRGGGNSGFLSGLFNPAPSALTGFDKYTAVYDISARTVYLPDGTRLEAHSGLGDRLDDPRFVSERMRGATPPHLYELEPREALFHGVPALRLIPVGGGDLFGRAGLLAHSYMLGPNGQSNGCVSFKNYDAFLRAYQNGQIKRLAVVARLNG